ncbi:hypothetical protein [Priestia megaterium]|uniref:hypothetical protein n=1 Tax=Priestia megaterium TaxID=1404 RepID=UPI002E1BB370|nr:hypothetical protein [Priestia megaterium]
MSNKDELRDLQLELVMHEDGGTSRRIIVNDVDKYALVDKEKAAAWRKKMDLENQRAKDARGKFVISKNEPIKSLESSGITIADRRYLMQLVIYANINGKPLSKDGTPLTTTDIANIWGVTYKVAARRLKKFIDLGIINKISDKKIKHYSLDENYFLMGKGIKPGEKFVKVFKTKLNEIIQNVADLEKRQRKNKDLLDIIGLLNAVMPYFHYQTYYLVKNPDDNILQENENVLESLKRDPSQLKHLTRTQIGRVLGYKKVDLKTIEKYMDYLQKAGAVMVLLTKGKPRYLIHPDLLFRMDGNGTDDYTEYVRNLFNQHN